MSNLTQNPIGGSGGTVSSEWGSITGDINNQTDLQSELATKAPIDSPNFTGTPTADTQSDTDVSTKLATTEFVNNRITESEADAYFNASGLGIYSEAQAKALTTLLDGQKLTINNGNGNYTYRYYSSLTPAPTADSDSILIVTSGGYLVNTISDTVSKTSSEIQLVFDNGNGATAGDLYHDTDNNVLKYIGDTQVETIASKAYVDANTGGSGLPSKGIVNSDNDAGEGLYGLDSSGGAFNFTLPSATGSQQRRILTMNNGSTNNVTIKVQSGEKLNGVTNGEFTITTQNTQYQFIDTDTGEWVGATVDTNVSATMQELAADGTFNFNNGQMPANGIANFTDIDYQSGSDLSLGTNTSGAINGLKAGKTYRIDFGGNVSGTFTLRLEDLTSSTTIANVNLSSRDVIFHREYYTPPADCEVGIRFISTASNDDWNPAYFNVSEVGVNILDSVVITNPNETDNTKVLTPNGDGTATFTNQSSSAKDFLHAYRTGTDQTLIGSNTDLQINNTGTSRGSKITNNGDNTYTLLSGYLYKVTFTTQCFSFSSSTGFAEIVIVDDTNTQIANSTEFTASSNVSGIIDGNTMAIAYVDTSNGNVTIKVRCVASTGTFSISGVQPRSNLVIEEV